LAVFFAIRSFTTPAKPGLLAFDQVAGDEGLKKNGSDQSFRNSN
jgi:hypothetical protein